MLNKVHIRFISLIDRMHKPFSRHIPVETFRYGATGGANTFLDILLYFLFYNYILKKQIVHVAGISISPHIAAFLIVFPITFITGFAFAKYITFVTSIFKGRKQLFRYAITVAGAILLNYLLLKLFVEQFKIYPTPSKIITTIVVVAYSYVMQRYYSFRTGTFRKGNRVRVPM